MRLVLVGPPGAGKGTQARWVARYYDVPPISTGDIFRANVVNQTELGLEARKYMDAGDLVPDEVTIAMVADRLGYPDAAGGFLLDGFPRTRPQAEALDVILAELGTTLDCALELQINDYEVIRRLAGRRMCRRAHVWHVDFEPPTVDGVCDECGGDLFQRDDDHPATIRHRLDVHAEQTAPLIEHYRALGVLVQIRATGKVDEVTRRAIGALDTCGPRR